MTKETGRGSSDGAARRPGGSSNASVGGASAEGAFRSQAAGRPLLLGHRGARPVGRLKMATRVKIPPENTLACFEYALAQGCDGFEFDVRVSRDERLVLCHNASLRGLKIDVCSFEMLCSICDERVACLEDVLSAFGDRAYLDIEVKVAGSEELTLEALRRAKPRRYLVSSFLPEVLLRLHQLDPSLPLGYICDGSEYVRAWRELPIQVFLPQQKLVTEQLVREAHRRELQIFTWTVNREQDMTRLAAWGVDGLISDHPDLLCRTFQRLACPGQRPTGKS